ncbi:STAS domain-containing protein [Micromonospora pattaloongensis]|uniref:STAS domain-containing protein n=1 Tax=Micromonospora pattaloongensis TaxID=405436 RepID=UPI001FDF9C21|nr:STAS domain-containing protein [Micromonospora pattaloongensis]
MDQEGRESVFSATTELDGDHATVRVRGEVDLSTADTMFQAATRADAPRVTLDLREVMFFDSAAIQALIRLADHCPELTVLPSRQVRRVLDISGLGEQPWLATT